MEQKAVVETPENNVNKSSQEEPQILEEIVVEELSIDGICGVY
jgi:mycofactocin precursor